MGGGQKNRESENINRKRTVQDGATVSESGEFKIDPRVIDGGILGRKSGESRGLGDPAARPEMYGKSSTK